MLVQIARLVRPRGIKGELNALSLTDRPERFDQLGSVHLSGAGREIDVEVERVWWHDGRPVFKFVGIDSRTAAEPLAGAEVGVPLDQRVPIQDGAFYQSDIIGCEVLDAVTGESLGVVSDWLEYGGTPLLEVRSPALEKDLLIPFAKAICTRVEVEAKKVYVNLPEGLKDL